MDNSLYKQPLYDQLVNILREKIETGMQTNEQLPSERELTKTYGLSRNTVRQALNELEIMGYIYRRHGKGTFVSNQFKAVTNLSETYSFSEQMRSLGREPKTTILTFEHLEANRFFSEHLGIQMGDKIIKVKRLREADGLPLMVERTYLPQRHYIGLTKELLEKHSLYDLLTHNYAQKIHLADESFFASIISGSDADQLQVPPDSPCLKLTRTTYDMRNEIVEYTLSVARSDQFVYRVRHTPYSG